ncbi:MAG: transposase InsO family protein [Alteromonas macleodii]|jgi:transposase InsO family protein
MNQRQRDDLVLMVRIREQHRLSLQSYCRPRVAEELQELGLKVGHRRVGRLMSKNGIKIIRTQKYKATKDSNNTFNIAPNLLDQDFQRMDPLSSILRIDCGEVVQQPHETGSGGLGVRFGRSFETAARGLHSTYGLQTAMLFQRISTPPVQVYVQNLDERQRQLLRQLHG